MKTLNNEETCVDIQISDKIILKSRIIINYKERYPIMITWLINEEHITILNFYDLKYIFQKYIKEKMTKLKKQRISQSGDFNRSLSIPARQKISKDTKKQKRIIKLYLICIYNILHRVQKKHPIEVHISKIIALISFLKLVIYSAIKRVPTEFIGLKSY